MRILQVASEVFGLVKTGGLADAVAGLNRALLAAGEDSRLLVPAYPGCIDATQAQPLCDLGDPLGAGPTRLLQGRLPAADAEEAGPEAIVWLVDCPPLYDRPGGPYSDSQGNDWSDNHLRFGLLGRVAALTSPLGPLLGWTPDVVHAHDWQAGLAPALLSLWGGRRPATVFTVHNLHFRGAFDPSLLGAVGLPAASFDIHGVELYGALSFLKAGLYYADRLTTVSPTYAHEIQGPLGGGGLDGLLSARAPDLHGILNGIDGHVWNPATDPRIAASFDASDPSPRARNKLAVQRRFELAEDPDAPLLGSVGRLTAQKGIDLLVANLPKLLDAGAQLAVIGSGDGALEEVLRGAAQANPGRVGFFGGYDESLSHLMFAGADLFVVPSRFEPCGLTQMYAMRYGAVPVVRRTGGLVDTVVDEGDPGSTGFTFYDPTWPALGKALDRALQAFDDLPRWRALQARGMRTEFGWGESAARYVEVYEDALTDSA